MDILKGYIFISKFNKFIILKKEKKNCPTDCKFIVTWRIDRYVLELRKKKRKSLNKCFFANIYLC